MLELWAIGSYLAMLFLYIAITIQICKVVHLETSKSISNVTSAIVVVVLIFWLSFCFAQDQHIVLKINYASLVVLQTIFLYVGIKYRNGK